MYRCPACKVNPKSHSFDHIANAPNGMRIFYTAPALSEELDGPTKARNMKFHLDDARTTKWVWVIDCSKMESKHSSSLEFIRYIADVLHREHVGILQHLIVLNSNMWVRWVASVAGTFVDSEVLKCLVFSHNIFEDLQKLNMPTSVIHAVLVRNQSLSSLVQQ